MAAVLLAGCGKAEPDSRSVGKLRIWAEPEKILDEAPAEPEIEPDEEAKEVPEDSDEPDETVDYQVVDITGLVKAEGEIDVSAEDGQTTATDTDAVPSDTVEYVESDREEVMETRMTESIVDENDPKTYQVVQKEQETDATEEIPIEYTDDIGNVKYAFVDGSWYEYRYSSGDISMPGEEDEETALLLLNLFGEYDDYEVMRVDSSMTEEEGEEPVYAYHVLYRKTSLISELPAELDGLTASKTRQEVTKTKEIVEEKVPVMLKEQVGTGEYIYYGWQELDGDTYYFDKNGEKVTGMQVIKGIRYLFDEHGVLTQGSGVSVTSRNGTVDWKKVRHAGVEFALIRCGYRGMTDGMLVQDSLCEENIIKARRNGIDAAVYFYSQAVTEKEAIEEASVLVAMAGKHQISAPLVLAVGHTRDFHGRADGLSREDRTACVRAFCRTVQNAGYTPMLYGSGDWLNTCLDMAMLEEYPVWLAQYNSNVTYTGSWEIWQYTARAEVDGISGYTGLSIKHEK